MAADSEKKDDKKDDKKEEPITFIARTPDSGFRGERAGVKFFDGMATIGDKAKAEELKILGYQVLTAAEDGKNEAKKAAKEKAAE